MCGILGIITPKGTVANLSREAFERVRDAMAHRGPDGAGTWQRYNVLLGHRRLAVIEPTPVGAQPMRLVDTQSAWSTWSTPRAVIVYNGELYNTQWLQEQLDRGGRRCVSLSDTETLLRWIDRYGAAGLPMLRGMYAFGVWRDDQEELVVARDPLGIKPLYYAMVTSGGVEHFCFASELQAMEKLLGALHVSCEPDMVTVSADMTTIRTTLGSRTLLRGVQCVQPGEYLVVKASDATLRVERGRTTLPTSKAITSGDAHVFREMTRDVVRDSVKAHLISDVPVCTLLSGGLDSAIVASVSRTSLSFCAGAQEPGFESPDFAFAREAASLYGMQHTEAVVTREHFAQQWPAMVRHNRQPLSTPNEVAIHHVATTLRAAGCVVTLSGEGADELFGGYDLALLQAREAWRSGRVRSPHDAGEFELDATAWIGRALKQQVLTPDAYRAAEGDEHLTQHYRDAFASVAEGAASDDPLQMHLRWQRSINLTGLLQRLDTSTMMASVEGRTPFADVRVMQLAEQLPLHEKLRTEASGVTTKAILREAFADDVLASILRRPKASFPLPFQKWMADLAPALERSEFVKSIISPGVLEQVRREPSTHWHLAWPLINVALWR